MPNIIKRAATALAAFKSSWYSGNWVDSDLPGNRSIGARDWHFEPQTNLNYGAIVGDIWTNSAVQACLNWIIRAWPESYPCIKEKDPKTGKKVLVEDHPLLAILEAPSEFTDDTILWAGTILSFWCDGNAYWGINRKRNGEIGEFVYLPHFQVQPKKRNDYDVTRVSDGPDYFEYYDYRGFRYEIPVEDIIHFRFGIDPRYPLMGLSPWASVDRHVFTDNEAINYVAATLGNKGTAWAIVTPKDANTSFGDLAEVKTKIVSATTGDKRGGVLVLDAGINLDMPPTMREQGVNELHRLPETRVCALAGIPAITIGFASGIERSTFSNTDQAEAAAWNTIVAVQRMMGRQATRQIFRRPGAFPQYERANSTRLFYIGFDYSEVRALQPDKQKEWERVGEAYDRGLITDTEARMEMGYDKLTALQRLELKPASTGVPFEDQQQGSTPPKMPAKPQKALPWDARHDYELQLIEALETTGAAANGNGNGVHA